MFVTPFHNSTFGRFARKTVGWIRALAYAATFLGITAIFFASQARARTGEVLLHLGRQLHGFQDLTEDAYTVNINGESVRFASASSPEPVSEVLDRITTHCNDQSPLPPYLRSLAAETGAPTESLGLWSHRGEGDGAVACLVRADGAPPLAESLERFAETLNLAEVGLLRYVYARQKASGDTHVITVWTDADFNLGALLPRHGQDSPGVDIPGIPRPTGSTRLLSAILEGTPHGIWIYDAPGTVGEVTEAQDQAMSRSGWQRIPGIDATMTRDGEGRVYARSARELFFTAGAAPGTFRTAVSFAHSGFGGG